MESTASVASLAVNEDNNIDHRESLKQTTKGEFGAGQPNLDENFPVTNHAFEHGVCLPSFAALTVEEVTYVCDVIRKYYEEKNA